MTDRAIQSLTRALALDPTNAEAALALRQARIRAGLDTPEVSRTFSVLDPLHLVPLRDKVAKLNKAGAKRGALPLALYEAPEARYVPRTRPDGSTAMVRVRDVTLVGDAPATTDWRYAARLDHAPSGTMIVRALGPATVPDETLDRYRARGPRCDHCDVRRKRNDTFVLRHEVTGEVIQLGRACLEAYLGGSPEAAVYSFDMLADMTAALAESAALRDAPEALAGVDVRDFLAAYLGRGASGGQLTPLAAWAVALTDPEPSGPGVPERDYPAADEVLTAARAVMLPALKAERDAEALRALNTPEAEVTAAWPAGVRKLPLRWHNVAVILAEGYAPQAQAERAASLVAWHKAEAARAERTRLADPAEAVKAFLALGGELAPLDGAARAVVSGPLALAHMILDPKAQALARAILAAHEGPAEDNAPEPSGDFLAEVGTEGTWRATVVRVRPFSGYRSGFVVVLDVPGSDGRTRRAVAFPSARPSAGDGDEVTVTGTVGENGYDTYDRRNRSILRNVSFTD
jgi:hypothetical protein